MLRTSNSMKYFQTLNENLDLNILPPTSIISNYSENNIEASNVCYTTNIIQKKNSATILTTHNYPFQEIIQTITPVTITEIKTINYNIPIYPVEENNITYINQNNPIQITSLRKFHSSENLNYLNLPTTEIVTEEANKIPVFNTNPNDIIMHCKTNFTATNNKNKSKIPHPEFTKKKLLPQFNQYMNRVKPNHLYYNTQIISDQNVSNNNFNTLNSLLNDSINITHNYSISSFNSSLPSENLFQIKNEDEPGININLSEFITVSNIGNGSEGSIDVVSWKNNNKNYALKKCEIIFDADAERRKKEFNLMKELIEKTGCDGIIKTYGILCEKNHFGTYYFYELMELADRDWEKEIKNRQNNQLYYQESELIQIFSHLIKTLAALQKNHYTHRDIKPQNIMLVNGKYKIGDFGNGKLLKREGIIVQRIRGSELFMSPILFKAYHSGVPTVKHNTFKSDVFSLGMCFFYAACLYICGLNAIREIYDINIITKVINQMLGNRYSQNLINLLLNMLQVDESKRPDFIELEKYVINQFN